MKKRIAGIFALTLAFATLLGGCGSKMTTDDAKSYAQACLDASYKGEFDEYLSQTDSTKEEAHTAEIELLGLFAHSYQGDSRGAEVFTRLGVHTEYTDRGVKLTRKGTPATRLDEDMVDIPDLAQTFVVTCCLMDIPFRFTGLQSLKIKETDRITALITELRKLGYVVRSEQDSILLWDGERCPADADPVIATYEDHRMAMAFAPACLVLPQIRINEPQVVTKSYPAYWEDLQKAGFKVCQDAMQS